MYELPRIPQIEAESIVIPNKHKIYRANDEPTEQALFEEFGKRAMEAGYQISFANIVRIFTSRSRTIPLS